jgi:hypothetical protein
MTNHRFENLSLFAPKKLAKTVPDPADRITDVRTLGCVEQISEDGPF